ncbi:hypothetical protein AX14_014276 [Amanita brunnescens Koide BX004]|nr:hypothetical protein AX14_014276 [Amanita brunnescens Koide BX004]
MAPRLRILAGPSPDSLTPITHLVNTSTPFKFSSELFEGEISLHIKDFVDDRGEMRRSGYFDREDREGITWSIQTSGRFLVPQNADDIMFGNIFNRRLRLPRGSSAAVKFMKLIDPTIEHDLTSQTKPWALSPMVATMPYCSRKYVDEEMNAPQGPGLLREISLNSQDGVKTGKKRKHLKFDSSSHRQKYFRDPERRKEVEFGPEEIISTDFCHGFLEFNPSIALRLPIGISFNLLRYWDKHPVRFVCCERKKGNVKDGEDPWGRVFWCVAIEIAEPDTSRR